MKLRDTRWFVVGFMAFVVVALFLVFSNALGEDDSPQILPTFTVPAASFTLIPTETLTLTPLLPTETLTPTPTPVVDAYPRPGTGTPPSESGGAFPGGYPPPGAGNPTQTSSYPAPGGSTATLPAATATTEGAVLGSPTPSQTPFPSPTQPLVLPCNLFEFVKDVTYPPKAPVWPGETFTKTWQVRNGGSCTWDSGYELFYVDGDKMDAKNRVPLTGFIAPNTFADLSVDFRAPRTPGIAKSFWLMRSDEGEEFGYGVTRDQRLEARVEVRSPNPEMSFDLVNLACMGQWRSTRGLLPCQGNPDSTSGSVLILENPLLEIDRLEDEPTLWTRPSSTAGGYIRTTYPDYVVQSGDRFQADVGCLQGAEFCDLEFSVGYYDETNRLNVLATYEEEYDGDWSRIDIDLSPLAGQEIKFWLEMRYTGSYPDAQGFWLAPGVRNFP